MGNGEPLVRTQVNNSIGRLTLSDPATRNALSKAMSDQIAEAVATALEAGALVLILDATPPVFCSGGSLDGLLASNQRSADAYAGHFALAEAPVPTIAAIAAPAIGAGVSLPLVCDVVLAGESARFDPRFLDVGIHPGGGHLWRLSQRIGEQGAAAMVLCGDQLTGAEAAATGLAWRCVPDHNLESLVTQFAERVASRSPALVQRTKESLQAIRSAPDLRTAHSIELAAQEWSVEQPEFRETVEKIRRSLRAR
ncbi:enoyl-CoA hydratase-related protein [Rhodococcus sp. IEGM 1366]|uniref:enoyl-CoA hydratase-related protein n=1 Tax=Rhodococcus sp. IEGM 1366 TaxID=3082223 RepID=UPI002952F0BD|nr:enoyl-CoA hydratase-related protein [Rhodococcus sp. IEGM 1366]MDV8071016.1 enoyl-CoA hydratase-related protein [Rhodococcus sp. IEGM 1366]